MDDDENKFTPSMDDDSEKNIKNRPVKRLILVALVGFLIFLGYQYWYVPNQQKSENLSQSVNQISVVSLSKMTDSELQKAIDDMYLSAYDAGIKSGEAYNLAAISRTNFVIIYQNELMLRRSGN